MIRLSSSSYIWVNVHHGLVLPINIHQTELALVKSLLQPLFESLNPSLASCLPVTFDSINISSRVQRFSGESMNDLSSAETRRRVSCRWKSSMLVSAGIARGVGTHLAIICQLFPHQRLLCISPDWTFPFISPELWKHWNDSHEKDFDI